MTQPQLNREDYKLNNAIVQTKQKYEQSFPQLTNCNNANSAKVSGNRDSPIRSTTERVHIHTHDNLSPSSAPSSLLSDFETQTGYATSSEMKSSEKLPTSFNKRTQVSDSYSQNNKNNKKHRTEIQSRSKSTDQPSQNSKNEVNRNILKNVILNEHYKKDFESLFSIDEYTWPNKKEFSQNGFCELPPFSNRGLSMLNQYGGGKEHIELNMTEDYNSEMCVLRNAIYYFTAKILTGVLKKVKEIQLEEPRVNDKTRNNLGYGFRPSPATGAFLHQDMPQEKVTVIIPGLGSGTKQQPNSSSTLILKHDSIEKIEYEGSGIDGGDNQGVNYFLKKSEATLTEADFFTASTQEDQQGDLWTRGILFCGGSLNPWSETMAINKRLKPKTDHLPAVIHTSPAKCFDSLVNLKPGEEAEPDKNRTVFVIHFDVT